MVESKRNHVGRAGIEGPNVSGKCSLLFESIRRKMSEMDEFELTLGPVKDSRVDFAEALRVGFEAVRDGKTAWIRLNDFQLDTRRGRGRPIVEKKLAPGWIKPVSKPSVLYLTKSQVRLVPVVTEILNLLKDGPRWSTEIFNNLDGLAQKKDVYRAAKQMGNVIKYPVGHGADQRWMWELSDDESKKTNMVRFAERIDRALGESACDNFLAVTAEGKCANCGQLHKHEPEQEKPE